jgi:hypothetical protein
MKLHLVIPLLFLLFPFCRQRIDYDNIQNKDGLYFDKSTGKLLNGKYKSVTYYLSTRETVIKKEFEEGVQIEEWEEWKGDELIHQGKYLKEDELADKIKSITDSKRVNFNLWKEADFVMLSVELIQPTYADKSTLEKIVGIAKKELKDKLDFKSIIIDSISNSNVERRIFEHRIK